MNQHVRSAAVGIDALFDRAVTPLTGGAMPLPTGDADPAALPAIWEAFRGDLVRHGLLIDTGVDGLLGKGGAFEAVVDGLNALISRHGRDEDAEAVAFPPGMPRVDLAQSGYLKSFPQFAGTVHSFEGDARAHARLVENLAEGCAWSGDQAITDVALIPAACYPLYPMAARRGPVPARGHRFTLCCWCFRHEPSRDPARMQMFRQREYVFIGQAEDVTAFRARWMERGQAVVRALALPHVVEVANDPFFGRAGKMMAASQRDQKLKFELLVPIANEANPTACVSFNYHQDHFGHTWGLTLEDGSPAHTACVGFGMERITLALFRHHGFDVKAWPAGVRETLGL